MSSKGPFTIGLIQEAVSSDRETQLEASIAHVREAASQGAQIICLQELFNSPYFCKTTHADRFDLAEPIPGPTTSRMQELARELEVVIIVPLFVIMGYLVYHAGFATQIFETARAWLGHRTGGIPMAAVLGCAAFGAASGSGLASTATLARITIPEMIAAGVDKRLAYGVVAAAGPLAQMIPPSVLMIIYAIIAEQSVGKLLIGGIAPAAVIVVAYVATIYVRVKLNPALAPSMPPVPFSERLISLRHIWGIGVLALAVIGGIYSGVFTPTEAGAVGATWALFLTIIVGRLTWKVLKESINETIRTTSMVFLIVIGAFIFSHFLSITRLPTTLSSWIVSLPVEPVVIIVGIVILYLILGMFIDMVAAMFITLPIILPAVSGLGYDLIWFGVFLGIFALAIVSRWPTAPDDAADTIATGSTA